ncbi:MAG: PEP-CTERM-box response regulator transcription factor [Kiloniellales bacterium]|nr:PEP-CTERM-box response regulator transcription factor [Kiloniellales bacterium]
MSANAASLLIVDDDDGLRRQLRWAFDGLEVFDAGDREAALSVVGREQPPVVLLDLGLPPDPDGPSEGLRTLREILSAAPETKVIVMTGQEEREYALKAIAFGAYDFYQKPLEVEILQHMIQRAVNLHALETENRRLATASAETPLTGFVTSDPETIKVCEQIRRFAAAGVTVLLIGESGTGKEVLARAVHEMSDRVDGPFVAINCAAIPENLLESELFGYEKGAFTGAVKTTPGKVELANKGSLLLDEISELPMPLQAKLLRFLQERVVERVGGRKQISVDIRVIAATNRDPRSLIEDGGFREDLFFRLSEAVVNIPPLRKRAKDVVILSHHLLERYCKELGRNLRGFTPDALAALSRHHWPGNVRELENRIKRAVVTAERGLIDVENLDLPKKPSGGARITLKQARQSAEEAAIKAAMAEAEGNISRAAKILGTSRPTLYNLLEQYKLQKPS